jgi:hypothetical protein
MTTRCTVTAADNTWSVLVAGRVAGDLRATLILQNSPSHTLDGGGVWN